MNGNVLNVVNSRADGVHKRPVGRPLKRRSSRGSDTNRAKCETSNGWSRASNTSSGDRLWFLFLLFSLWLKDYKSKQLNASNKQLITYLHDIFHNFGQNESKSKHVTNSLTNESTITAFIESEELKNRFETQLSQQNDCHEFLSTE
ncbi:unnamed protein product [Oppiella nova]|uniref:Uncharacterized protein n=1 Tax=Oppiella nova TaxID=334625 RepID=A0A7R9M7D3_9ACAR|nr:unnamed protein product [Oppiella nova]CAG2172165.1 unnamed protein product [Oppiella nova]